MAPENASFCCGNVKLDGLFSQPKNNISNKIFNTFFETAHCLTAEQLAKMYGFTYLIASNSDNLQTSLESLYLQNEQPAILEVFTPTLQNDKILLNFFKALR